MRKARMFLISGIWVAILPYLGFPHLWKNILLTLSGLWIAYVSYLLYREGRDMENAEKVFDNFRENLEQVGNREIKES